MISSPSTLVWLVIFLFAVIGLARLAPMAATLEFGGTASRLAAGRRGAWPIPRRYLRALSWQQVLARLLPVGEAGAVVLWAMWVGRAYLDGDPNRWPYGTDFSLNVQGYFAWQTVQQCGLCVLWNGSLNGGAPLFAELLAAVAHPLVVVFIMLWGVINGLKLTLVAALAIAGLAQWWMARVLKLGWVARLWSAAMAVVGGNIDVQCQTTATGQLVVNENLWSGWSVSRDGFGARLGSGPRLTTDAPAGTHVYRFRYRPVDVALGVLMTLAGLIWLARLIFMPAKLPAAEGA